MNTPEKNQAVVLDGGSAALVIGGGLAGAALATLLAREGRRVTLMEQHAQPEHKVCGEFLSAEALHYLRLGGVDAAALGAVPIERVRLATGQAVTERRLPFVAMSLSRKVLDETLLRRCVEAGAVVRRGERTESLLHVDGVWVAVLQGGDVLTAPAAFVATGKHDLRGHARPEGAQGGLVAFKQRYRLTAAQQSELERYVELMLFPGGYAGLQMVEGGVANLGLLVDRERFKQIGGSWTELLEHMQRHNGYLADRLEGAEALMERPMALSRIPYGFLRDTAVPRVQDGEISAGGTGLESLWHVGDQAAVIPSFSGDGMSIALHTAHLAAAYFLRGLTPHEMYVQLGEQMRGQMRVATALSQAMVKAQPLVATLARMFPGLLTMVARTTRIRGDALISQNL